MGILAADNNGWLLIACIVLGGAVLTWFFLSMRAKERAGTEPLLSPRCSTTGPRTWA